MKNSLREEFLSICSDPNQLRRYANFKEYVADRMYLFRKHNNGMSQAKLAAELDICPMTITNWENPLHRSEPSPHNQKAFLDFERKQWIDKNWNDNHTGLTTPATHTVRELIRLGQDKTAQELSEYLLQTEATLLTPVKYIHLCHVASLAYAVESNQTSEAGQKHAEAAFKAANELPATGPNQLLTISIRNEILGYQCTLLTNEPYGDSRLARAEEIAEQCDSLFEATKALGRPDTTHLWNALECLLLNGSTDKAIHHALNQLCKVVGKERLIMRIKESLEFVAAIPYLHIFDTE